VSIAGGGARVLSALAGAALVALAARGAVAGPGRYAIVVGNDAGSGGEVVLRYAESDARRVADVLRAVGGFYPENVTVLAGASAEDLRRSLISLNARLRALPGVQMLFVFYSGHADGEALQLGNTRMELSELRDLTTASPAEARVLVVDSCRSGALTRVKGARPVPSFAVEVEAPPAARGVAILTSSAAGEDAQESDQLGASVFTHHLISALRGAADRNRDGRVTIAEAFAYAADRTLAATVLTFTGPQHPTYRLDLAGRDDLSLTEPGLTREGQGGLVFDGTGPFLVQRDGGDRAVVAEVAAERAGARLAVEPGRYFVTERNPEFLRQGSFSVARGADTLIATADMQRVDYARVVRKGAVERDRAVSVFAIGSARGEILDLGMAVRGDLGLRLDLRPISLELRAGSGASWHRNDRLGTVSQETTLSAAALHMFDFDRWSAGLGLEIGAAWFAQRLDDVRSHDRNALAALVAPLVEVEVPLGRAWYGRFDGAFVSYFLPSAASVDASVHASYRVGVGGGAYF
jgi:Caspase domain